MFLFLSSSAKAATIALVGVAIAWAFAKADEANRRATEARALFPTVLADEPPAQRCGYDDAWQKDSIPENIARKYFGLALHPSLSAPEHNSDMRTMLDPTGHQPAAFCTEAERAEYQQARFEAMKKDASSSAMEIITRYFTFPVFDTGYRTAIVVVTGRRDVWARAANPGTSERGDVGRFPPDVATVAKVFRKTPKGWSFVKSEVISQT